MTTAPDEPVADPTISPDADPLLPDDPDPDGGQAGGPPNGRHEPA
jgi:hypothetical protein